VKDPWSRSSNPILWWTRVKSGKKESKRWIEKRRFCSPIGLRGPFAPPFFRFWAEATHQQVLELYMTRTRSSFESNTLALSGPEIRVGFDVLGPLDLSHSSTQQSLQCLMVPPLPHRAEIGLLSVFFLSNEGLSIVPSFDSVCALWPSHCPVLLEVADFDSFRKICIHSRLERFF